MPLFVRFLICLAVELVCIFGGLFIGEWWPVRDMPRNQIGPGDGIGIFLYGIIGVALGAVIGGCGIMLSLSIMRLVAHRRLAAHHQGQ